MEEALAVQKEEPSSPEGRRGELLEALEELGGDVRSHRGVK